MAKLENTGKSWKKLLFRTVAFGFVPSQTEDIVNMRFILQVNGSQPGAILTLQGTFGNGWKHFSQTWETEDATGIQ